MTHPTPDQLAVFAEGALIGDERAAVIAHCAGCPECREVVSEVLDLAGADDDPLSADALRDSFDGRR